MMSDPSGNGWKSLAAGGIVLLCFTLVPTVAQQEAEEEQPPPEAAAGAVDDIFADEALDLAGGGYTYQRGDRRDPFRSLLIRDTGGEEEQLEGIPGLLIGEVDLTGLFITSSGPIAQVHSTKDDKSYLLRPGDELRDGKVLSITAQEVVFQQELDDPTRLKPFQEVVKQLYPQPEG